MQPNRDVTRDGPRRHSTPRRARPGDLEKPSPAVDLPCCGWGFTWESMFGIPLFLFFSCLLWCQLFFLSCFWRCSIKRAPGCSSWGSPESGLLNPRPTQTKVFQAFQGRADKDRALRAAMRNLFQIRVMTLRVIFDVSKGALLQAVKCAGETARLANEVLELLRTEECAFRELPCEGVGVTLWQAPGQSKLLDYLGFRAGLLGLPPLPEPWFFAGFHCKSLYRNYRRLTTMIKCRDREQSRQPTR